MLVFGGDGDAKQLIHKLFVEGKRLNSHQQAVVELLPYLVDVLNDSSYRHLTPRSCVRAALDKCDTAGRRFWGAYQVYTRRRSVEDAVIGLYFDQLVECIRRV
jgi:hypothetical protein